MKRRAISFITVLVLCLSLCPTRVLAAELTSYIVGDDKTVYKTYDVKEPLKFDTCGYSYTSHTESDAPVLRVTSTGSLYLTYGTIESKNGAGVEVQNGGFLCVEDPRMKVIGTTYGLNIESGAVVELSGGTFTGGTAAILALDYAALLVTGCAFFDESGDPILLYDADGNKTGTEMAGAKTVTVKECTAHVYGYAKIENIPNHNRICLACGTKVTESCTFRCDESGHAACEKECGHTLDITVYPASEVYDGGEKPSGAVGVTVNLDGATDLSETSDYTVDRPTRVDVGETTITVTSTDQTDNGRDPAWSYKTQFSVTQAKPGITWQTTETWNTDDPKEVDYTGSPVDKSVLPEVEIDLSNPDDLEEMEEKLYFSYKAANADDNSYTRGLPADVGTYEIKANLPETANYKAASSDSINLIIRSIYPIIDAPEAAKPVYNGTARKLVTSGTVDPDAVGAVILFATSEDGPWSTDIPTGINAGDYIVYYKVEGTANYAGVGPFSIDSVKIRRKPITPDVELEYTSYVYTGGEIQPKVTVRDPENWEELPGTEYDMVYTNNVAVGGKASENPPTVTVSDKKKGNYEVATTSVIFEITAANQAGLTITGQPDKVEYGDVFTLGTSGGSGNGTVTWKITAAKDAAGTAITNETDFARVATIADETIGQVKVNGLGWFTVQATKSGTDSSGSNRVDATDEVTFHVDPKPVTATVTAKSRAYNGGTDAEVTAIVEPDDLVTIEGVTDKIEIKGVTGTFSDANAGTHSVTVDIEDAEITGDTETINAVEYPKYIVTIPTTPVMAEITPKTVTPTIILDPDPDDEDSAEYYQYDGSEKRPTVTVKDPADTVEDPADTVEDEDDEIIPSTEYTVTYSNNVNAGTATVIVTDNAGGNYTVGTVKKTFTITTGGEDGLELTSSPLARDLTYNGQEQELVTVGTAKGGHLEYALEGANDDPAEEGVADGPTEEQTDDEPKLKFDRKIPVGIEAGLYKVYYKVVGDGNFAGAETEPAYVYVTIKPKTVNNPVIELNKLDLKEYTYDGTAKKPEVICVKDGDNEIWKKAEGSSAADEYFITYSNNVNVSKEATVRIVSRKDGNYSVDGSTTFEIKKADINLDPDSKGNDVTLPTPKGEPVTSGSSDRPGETALKYNGTQQELVIKGELPHGKLVYSLTENGVYSETIPTAAERKAYTIYYKVEADENHEESAVGKVYVSIIQNTVKTPTITVSRDQFTYDGTLQKPIITVWDDANCLIPNTEYDVEIIGKKDGSDEYRDVDTYTITIKTKTLKDEDGEADLSYEPNYTFDDPEGIYDKKDAYQILPADQAAISITGMPVYVYYGQEIQLSITGGTDEGEVKWEINPVKEDERTTNHFDDKRNGLLIINEVGGPYIITATRTSTSENYNTVSTTWGEFNTNPKPVTAVVTAENLVYDKDRTTATEIDLIASVPDADGIVFTELKGTLTDVNVGSQTVKIKQSYKVTGVEPNYVLTVPETTTALIKPADVTVTDPDSDTGVRPVNPETDGPKANKLDSESNKNLVHTGSPQDLLIHGTDLNGGTWAYSTDGVNYSVYVPQGTDAGEYKVWYKVIPDRNYKYDVDPQSVTVMIDKAEQNPSLSIVGKPDRTIHYGDQFTLSTSGGSGTGAIEWESSDPDVATISSSGLVEVVGVSEDEVTITATKAEDKNYKEAFAVCTFTVQPRPVTAKVTADNKTYDGNENATVHVTWESALVGTDTIDTSSVSGTFADVNVGTWTVTITHDVEDERYEITIPKKTSATISKATAEVDTPPQANSDPIYVGSNTPLLIPGTTVGGIGKVVYALENPNEEQDDTLYEDLDDYEDLDPDPPGLVYTEEIPTAETITQAGTYTVWYKIEPTKNWSGTEPKPVTVTIVEAGTPGGTPPGSAPSQAPSASQAGSSSNAASAKDKPGTEDVSMQTSVQDRTASTVLDTAAGSQLVDEAVASKSANVVIKPEITGDVTKTEVSLPASAVSRISSETDAALTVSTPVADVTIPNASLDTLSGADSTVSVVMERSENTVVLTLSADGKDVGTIPGGLTLTVPVEDAGPGTVAVLVHEDGTRETVRWSVVEDGAVRIPLNGSVTLEIVDNSKTFADVPAESWATDAVTFASAHELFSGTGEATFSPELSMSRAMLATVLYNLEGCPDQVLTSAFSDVNSDAWYAAGVSWAAANGITNGYGDGQFGPNDNVTREQLAAMLWRYMGSPAADEQVSDFMDADQASSYAMDALYWATANGILNGYGNGHLDPCGLATRAQAAQMLKNFIENT